MIENLVKSSCSSILKKITRYKNIHKGESCYLFGDGISIKYFDLKNFSDRVSIPCGFLLFHNDFKFLHVPYAMLIETYYFYPFTRHAIPPKKFVLNNVQNLYKEEINKNKDVDFFINLSNYPVLSNENIIYLYRDIPDYYLDENFISNRFNCYSGSLRAQLMLAIYMGFDHVYLIGHDYTHSPARSHHWYEKGNGIITPMENFSKEFLEYAQKFIDITTVTIESESNNLKYKKYKDLFNVEPEFKENTEILNSRYLEALATQPYNIF